MADRNIRIAYGTDMGLIGPTALSLASALRHTPRLGHVHVLGLELAPEAEALLARITGAAGAALHLHRLVPGQFDSARQKDRHVPRTALARLLLPQLVEGRVLYIDGDTLVRRDLAPLFDAALAGKLIGGVRDYGGLAGHARRARGKPWADEPMLRALMAPFPPEDYINSGVLLMDCAAIRAAGDLAEQMLDFGRAAAFRTVDQDFINLLFKGRVAQIDPAWNASWGRVAAQRAWGATLGTPAEAGPAGICHFHGPLKPWHRLPRERWRRSPRTILAYRLALWSFRRRFPGWAFG